MYTMVLMMAVTSSGDVSGFGHRKSGCHGDSASCQGSVVAANYAGASAGCTGTVVGAGYTGSSCQGSNGGMLGFREKLAGFPRKLLGGRSGSGSCHGSCHGSMTSAPVAQDCCPPAMSSGCTGGVITMPAMPQMTTPPKDMPKPMDKPKDDPKPKTESN